MLQGTEPDNLRDSQWIEQLLEAVHPGYWGCANRSHGTKHQRGNYGHREPTMPPIAAHRDGVLVGFWLANCRN